MRLPPFQVLLDRHGRDVHGFLRAMVGSDEADDAYQETFLSALRAYPRLRDTENLRGWLFTIASRKAVDTHRGRARRPRPVGEVPERSGPAQTDGDPTLWAAVRELPPGQRAAVAYRYVTDLAYADIGALLGCSEAAARQRVREGLTKLREVVRT